MSVLLGCTPAIALEPQYSDQVVPAAPQLKLVDGGAGSEQLVFVETATMGRVGDTGYVWKATMQGIAGSPPVFTRLVIDCPSATVREDWRTTFDTDLKPSGHEQLTATYRAADPVTQAIVDLACSGQPAAPDHSGIAAAMDWFIDQQLGLDNLLAQFDPSLLRVAVTDSPVKTLVFIDENSGEWLIGSGQATIRQFFAYAAPVKNDEGSLIRGAWVDITFDCDVKPITYAPTRIVQIDATTLQELPELTLAPRTALQVEPEGVMAEIAGYACVQSPIARLEGAQRLTSPQAAIEAATSMLAADNLYDDQPPSSNLSLVRIADQTTDYPATMFYDENSVALNIGSAWVWQFVVFKTPVQLRVGETSHGLWIQMQYLCIAPSTAHALGMVPVDEAGQLLPWRPAEIDDRDVPNGSREMDMANHACRQMPIDGQRVSSVAEAMQAAR